MKTNQRLIALALLLAFISNSLVNAQSVLKRKWNPEAKGVAIGAGAGGLAGALIHKRDRKVGAGVGLAVGAAVGYGVGKVIDNRHKRAAAAAQAAEQREYAARTAPAYHTEGRSRSHSVAHRAAAPVAAAATRNALAAPTVAEAEVAETPVLTKNGYLLNTAYGDPNSAYPNSEYRRKSW
ncbi:hypothetical protein J2I47_00655 [Fibrella sp. HMF5335]|uniref:Glycine zipper 2TM domain-containing protein n=1 Tax=Fibrella rubiginis TaxID=2817060 RepID=A0A939GA14_9BACT|nr:hypothetical protein [Fibrella rubiginis]MBO0935044.1 hypothetical protein [Fibrella rubiginis]